ncbi:MAG: radical SAM protein [Rhodospirillales bacterium]|nr:radical SAM protein [Rhodospirillales bacterium]
MAELALEGKILAFGGAYSNVQALEALLALAKRHGIPPERMICTGDIVAYGADPRPCIGLIRDTGIPTVMGNCEEQLAANQGDCGCGFTPGSACDRLSAAWFAYANGEVSIEDRAWMEALPRQIILRLGRRCLAVLHGAPSRINRFLFASDPDEVFAQELDLTGVDGVIAGHSGLPFTRILKDGRIWHNAGAIGMPANDGTPRGWYAIIEPKGEQSLRFTLHPLAYDHHAAAAAMRRARLPEEYAQALETGIWPNLDILPHQERAATATPLPAAPKPDAQVALERLETLWFNTGTLCNLACKDCYIESSPRNDALSWLSLGAVHALLDEAAQRHPELREVAFTGGEPFMNPQIMEILETALDRDLRVLVLTNAMTPLRHHLPALRRLAGQDLHLRVSLDHYTEAGHTALRGPRAWGPALEGISALLDAGFAPSIAARFNPAEEDEAATRAGFADLFQAQGWDIDAFNEQHLVLFPEMSVPAVFPGVSAAAWAALHPRGADAMCRTSRMVVQRKGAPDVSIVACTLLPFEPRFELGHTLAEAARPVTLDHPHCARFCVFGASSCMSVR